MENKYYLDNNTQEGRYEFSFQKSTDESNNQGKYYKKLVHEVILRISCRYNLEFIKET